MISEIELKELTMKILSCCDLSDDKSKFLLFEGVIDFFTEDIEQGKDAIARKVYNFLNLLNSEKNKSEEDLKLFLQKDFDEIWDII